MLLPGDTTSKLRSGRVWKAEGSLHPAAVRYTACNRRRHPHPSSSLSAADEVEENGDPWIGEIISSRVQALGGCSVLEIRGTGALGQSNKIRAYKRSNALTCCPCVDRRRGWLDMLLCAVASPIAPHIQRQVTADSSFTYCSALQK